ncbi:MAG TPA: winged helix-turn-helix domain-containing protein [Pyrinomonadaceae bacterium]|jgi:DNA-binding winged helix-turn-helix (wHTH) protein/TolB-like protein/Tfp pilus assembly protein PilF|nr:winged helix-turn-helix domain-containing protein [Pyrinomonadaceae bacterium]
MAEQTSDFYEFGRFRVKSDERLLLRGEDLVPLTPKAFDILLTLLENNGRIVNKDDLMKKVWPNTFVEEGNLTQNVSLLRKALGESANGPQFIETVPRRGYRFVAHVNRSEGNGVESQAGNGGAHYSASPLLNAADTAPPVSLERDGQVAASAARQSFVSRRLPAIVLTLAVAAVTVAGIVYLSGRNKAGASPNAIQSIAVLPFVDDSATADAEFLDDEIAASLVNSLTKLPQLRVVPRSVMMTYKGRNIDPRQVGKELNVRAVVTGRVHRRGDTISIQADLIDLDSVSQIWGQHYERRLSDMLLVQEEISRDIFENLRLKLNVEEQKQLEAYRLYLKGRNAWNKRTREGMQQGIEYFQQAINADPNYAAAYAGLADCYNMQVIYGVSAPKDGFPKAKEAAVKALEMDETLAEAHTSLAFIKFRWDRDRVEAEREFQLAIKHKANYAPAHQWYSSYLVALERFDEAIAEAKRTSELEPLSFTASSHLGWILYLSGRNDEAIAQCTKILSLDPNSFPARRYLGLAYEQKGMYPQAIDQFQQGVKLSGSPLMLALLGHAYAVSGKTKDAQQVISDLRELSESRDAQARRYVSPYTVAAIHAGLGDKDQAFKLLEQALEERDVWLMNLKVDPVFAKLRSDKRFQDLLTRAGLRP